MVHAYVLVKTSAGKSAGLLATIRSIELISDAHIVAGNYDVIAEVEAEAVHDVLETVSSELQSLDGILDTKSYVAMD
ncbi:transcriptional regulator [Halovivax ruber XH-70]|uniref:Transcriptional regulator n=1 Tax=Halovivax ruber (strain DSM 18193 / JCM 13892 / XH-70) TaxID=797302 RepID=L0IBG4_HALRX|nr:Lrp/AsnC ligand binding domain-containing protein [Halovivax ruber]AGB15586.1 transcriptional regulator [Halovivax ruber XH-70]